MKILIVEDEQKAAKRLDRQIRTILEPEIPTVWLASSIEEANDIVQGEPIDLLMLDLNLNGESGFDLLEDLLVSPFQTIVVSAYRSQAIHAYEHGVLDFVPKPVDKRRLKKALDRFLGKGDGRPEAKYLAVKVQGRMKYVSLDDILYAQGANIYTKIVMKDGSSVLYEKSLDKVLQLLEPAFARIHKSYIVDLDEIADINSSEGSRYCAVLKMGESLPVGRTRVGSLRKMLESRGAD